MLLGGRRRQAGSQESSRESGEAQQWTDSTLAIRDPLTDRYKRDSMKTEELNQATDLGALLVPQI